MPRARRRRRLRPRGVVRGEEGRLRRGAQGGPPPHLRLARRDFRRPRGLASGRARGERRRGARRRGHPALLRARPRDDAQKPTRAVRPQPPARVPRRVRRGRAPRPICALASVPISLARGPRAVYLLFHGGGWVFGDAAGLNDERLEEMAETLGVVVLVPEYRKAPENPYPAPLDDCDAAAAWCEANAVEHFRCATDTLMMGGESAGGNLCAATLLRRKAAHDARAKAEGEDADTTGTAGTAGTMTSAGSFPWSFVNLVYGIYDVDGTPSVAAFGERRLVETARDLAYFADCYCPETTARGNPDVSPLFGDWDGWMPPAAFTVGRGGRARGRHAVIARKVASGGVRVDVGRVAGGTARRRTLRRTRRDGFGKRVSTEDSRQVPSLSRRGRSSRACVGALAGDQAGSLLASSSTRTSIQNRSGLRCFGKRYITRVVAGGKECPVSRRAILTRMHDNLLAGYSDPVIYFSLHCSRIPLTYTFPFSMRLRSRRMRSISSTSPSTMMSVVMSSSAVTIFTFICSLRPAFSM